MEVVTSFIIHKGIARKLGKCSYAKNKETASQGVHLDIFMYFPVANCWEKGTYKNESCKLIESIFTKICR